ncbi:MAG: hypothetical protein M5R40_12200 [Anaerolineae bacterium]|nr:hypothetical protein [Anaerolineae bacterium]
MTTSVSTPTLSNTEMVSQKRGCLFYFKRGLTWLGIALIALVVLGVAYQTIATETDRRAYSPRGQLFTVNGLQMHINCMGRAATAAQPSFCRPVAARIPCGGTGCRINWRNTRESAPMTAPGLAGVKLFQRRVTP